MGKCFVNESLHKDRNTNVCDWVCTGLKFEKVPNTFSSKLALGFKVMV